MLASAAGLVRTWSSTSMAFGICCAWRHGGARRRSTDASKLDEQILDLGIEGIQLEGGIGDEKRVVNAVELDEQIDVAEYGLGAVRAEGVGLPEGKIGLFDHPMLFLRGLGVGDAPVVDAGNRAAQLRERLLAVAVAQECGVAREVFRHAVRVVGLVGKGTNLGDGRVVVDPVTDKPF